MLKVVPTSKESLIYYLINNISLGTYDQKFLHNLVSLNVTKNHPVTTNQSDLLDKIVSRYRKQLAKKELDVDVLLKLEWNTKPVLSSPQFTQAYLSLSDDQIILHSPYKSEFVKDFKKIENVSWHRDEKFWSAPANEYMLKLVNEKVKQHYNTINYCPEITEILNTLQIHESSRLVWNPTLACINNRLYILASNRHVQDAIKDIGLELNLYTIAKMTHYGIDVDDSVYKELNKIYSIEEINYACDRDITFEHQVEPIIRFITTMNVDFVILHIWYGGAENFMTDLMNQLKVRNIRYVVHHKNHSIATVDDIKNYKLPISISNFGYIGNDKTTEVVAKHIRLVNSTPIILTHENM